MSMNEPKKYSLYKFKVRHWEKDELEIRNNPILRRLKKGTITTSFAKTNPSAYGLEVIEDSANLEECRSLTFSFETLKSAWAFNAKIYSYNGLDVFGKDEEDFTSGSCEV
jgi:hypothetical protein